MTSFKSRAINFLLRNRHLLQGKLHREVFDMKKIRYEALTHSARIATEYEQAATLIEQRRSQEGG